MPIIRGKKTKLPSMATLVARKSTAAVQQLNMVTTINDVEHNVSGVSTLSSRLLEEMGRILKSLPTNLPPS